MSWRDENIVAFPSSEIEGFCSAMCASIVTVALYSLSPQKIIMLVAELKYRKKERTEAKRVKQIFKDI